MKIKIISILIIIILSSTLPISKYNIAESQGINIKFKTNQLDILTTLNEIESQIWAIIISVGDVKRDAYGVNTLNDLLISQGYSKENIKKYIEENATKESILNAPFKWLKTNEIRENDIVIFYFSMHGNRIEDQIPLDEPDNYDEYLAPYDYDPDNKSSYILDEELGSRINDLNINNLLLIFETCYSGGMIDGDNDLKNSGRIIITSCDTDESSWPMYLRIRWLFPHFLFKGLLGPADINNNMWISAEEAFYYAEAPTIKRSSILAIIFSFIPYIPHDFVPQYPQIYDGWPSIEDNSEELQLIRLIK
jgi:hypothetical protein